MKLPRNGPLKSHEHVNSNHTIFGGSRYYPFPSSPHRRLPVGLPSIRPSHLSSLTAVLSANKSALIPKDPSSKWSRGSAPGIARLDPRGIPPVDDRKIRPLLRWRIEHNRKFPRYRASRIPRRSHAEVPFSQEYVKVAWRQNRANQGRNLWDETRHFATLRLYTSACAFYSDTMPRERPNNNRH